MMPLWISFCGQEFLQGFSTGSKINIPYGALFLLMVRLRQIEAVVSVLFGVSAKITRSLVSLVLPLLAGVGIKKWKPEWAAKSRKVTS